MNQGSLKIRLYCCYQGCLLSKQPRHSCRSRNPEWLERSEADDGLRVPAQDLESSPRSRDLVWLERSGMDSGPWVLVSPE